MEDYKGMIILQGQLFRFDLTREYLIETANPSNIKRIDQLDQDDKNVYTYFDSCQNKLWSIQDIAEKDIDKRRLSMVTIPRELIHHGDKLSDWAIGVFNNTGLKNKSGFHYIDQELDFRLNGQKAEIDINGFPYRIDFKTIQIYRKHRPEDSFQFSPSAILENEMQLYHSRCMRPVYHGELIRGDDTNQIIGLQFPPLSRLDQIGYAQHIGVSPWSSLHISPWRPEVSIITVVPCIEIVKKLQIENLRRHQDRLTELKIKRPLRRKSL